MPSPSMKAIRGSSGTFSEESGLTVMRCPEEGRTMCSYCMTCLRAKPLNLLGFPQARPSFGRAVPEAGPRRGHFISPAQTAHHGCAPGVCDRRPHMDSPVRPRASVELPIRAQGEEARELLRGRDLVQQRRCLIEVTVRVRGGPELDGQPLLLLGQILAEQLCRDATGIGQHSGRVVDPLPDLRA